MNVEMIKNNQKSEGKKRSGTIKVKGPALLLTLYLLTH